MEERERELEDVCSDLQALRKLYGLLHSSKDGLQYSSYLYAKHLDEKAQLLLKNMLDEATERVFKIHSKIMAAQSGVSHKPFSTQLEQSEATQNLQPPHSPTVLNASLIGLRNSSKDTFSTITLPNDELSATKPTHRGIVVEQPKISISSTKPEIRKKHCQVVCERSNRKQLSLAMEKTQSLNKDGSDQLSHVRGIIGEVKDLELKKKGIKSLESIEQPRQTRIPRIQKNLSSARSLASSSRNWEREVVKPRGEHNVPHEIEKNLEDEDYISKEVAKTIERIESGLAVMDSFKKKNAELRGWHIKPTSMLIPDTVNHTVQSKEGLGRKRKPSQAAELILAGNVLLSQQAGNGHRKVKDSSPMLSQIRIPVPASSQITSQRRVNTNALGQPASHRVVKSKYAVIPNNLPSQVTKPITGNEVQSVQGQNVKAITEKLMSASQLTSQNDHVPSQDCNYVQGLRLSPSQVAFAKESPSPAKTPSRINKESIDQNLGAHKGTPDKVRTSRQSTMSQSVGSPYFVGPSWKTPPVHPSHKLSPKHSKDKGLPHQIIVRPTLLDCTSRRVTVSPSFYEDQMDDRKSSRVHKSISMGPQRKILPHQQLSESSSSSSYYEDEDQTDDMKKGRVQKSISVGRRRKFPPHQQLYESSSSSHSYSSWTSQQRSTSHSESEEYSPAPMTVTRAMRSTSKKLGHMAPDVSSVVISSSQRRAFPVEPIRQVGPTKAYKTVHQQSAEKPIGRLKRLKNRLGLIFHHHHHHHHHHHDNNDVGHHKKSLWKSVQKKFHHTNKNEVAVSHAVVPHKSQKGQFHMLVKGLMSHVRNTNKSKASKGGIGQHGHNKKAVKNLHWWQMFGRKKGVKLPSKGRVKLGFKKKKPSLKVPKILK